MTPCRNYFTDINEFEGGKVIMGNNQRCVVKGIGTVTLELSNGSRKILKAVRYVLDLKRNLISLGTLDKAGYEYSSGNGTLTVMKDNVPKLSGKLKDGLYILEGKALSGEINVIGNQASNDTMLWHNRLAHIGEKGLSCLYQQGLIGTKKPSETAFFEHCTVKLQEPALKRPHILPMRFCSIFILTSGDRLESKRMVVQDTL